MKPKITRFVESNPWLWAVIGCLVIWIVIGIVKSHFSLPSLMANMAIASFLAIISLGQMFAVSSGGGGIDLSIPYVITLSAFLSMSLINGHNSEIWAGLTVSVVLGIVVGLINSAAILLFSMPPIVATMAVGFILNTGVLVYSQKFSTLTTSSSLAAVANDSVLGIPIIAVIAVLLSLFVGAALYRTPYGRSLMGVGQNKRVAQLAGIRVRRTIIIAYCLSGIFASIGGLMIASEVHGAFLGMGDSYLLESIGAVVIGGTLISGGKATVVGTLAGSLFLILIVSLMTISQLPIGLQQIIEGIVILLVLSMSSQNGRRRTR